MQFKRNVTIAGAEMNMTPLIDVVLQLIIFFMLCSSFVFNPGLKVDLPEYSSREPVAESDIIVTITEEPLYFYNENSVALAELRRKFVEAASLNPSARLIIKAANEVPHGAVVKVMLMAKDAGINNQAFATRSGEE